MSDAGAPKVGVVLLNWNGGEFTIPCIAALLESDPAPWRILVFDNGSTDGSPEQIEASYPDVQVIRSPDNIGFVAGNNVGIRELVSQGAEYVWILNNDTIVAPSCLGTLVDGCRSDPELAATTGKILFETPPDRIWYAGATWNKWSFTVSHRGARERDDGQYDEPEDVEFVSGCCMMIPSTVLEEVGPLDERYFLYCEDAEWCQRVRAKGLRLRYLPDAVLWHKVSATVRKNTLTASGGTASPKSHYLNHRNRLFNMRQYASRPLQLGTAAAIHMARASYLMAGLIVLRRWDKLGAVLRGLRDGIRTPL